MVLIIIYQLMTITTMIYADEKHSTVYGKSVNDGRLVYNKSFEFRRKNAGAVPVPQLQRYGPSEIMVILWIME